MSEDTARYIVGSLKSPSACVCISALAPSEAPLIAWVKLWETKSPFQRLRHLQKFPFSFHSLLLFFPESLEGEFSHLTANLGKCLST